jgi:hypothetical protein
MQTIDLAYVGCGIYEELARNKCRQIQPRVRGTM